MTDFLTLQEVAEMLQVTKRTAHKYLQQWKVPLVRHDRFIRILRSDLDKALNHKKHIS
ncbi:MAG: helix-turn-helix domain-containing protein [Planctomycetia bacterium]|nr:helix-turn-helix domain-containing protein [Planctomycetia bacterium]